MPPASLLPLGVERQDIQRQSDSHEEPREGLGKMFAIRGKEPEASLGSTREIKEYAFRQAEYLSKLDYMEWEPLSLVQEMLADDFPFAEMLTKPPILCVRSYLVQRSQGANNDVIDSILLDVAGLSHDNNGVGGDIEGDSPTL
jgi:hypothetical protein